MPSGTPSAAAGCLGPVVCCFCFLHLVVRAEAEYNCTIDTSAIEPLMLPQLQATPELNPLLGPVPSSGDKSGQHRVSWEILFSPPSYACASPAMSQSAWADRLRSPATFPRLRNLFIVSRSFPWVIHAHADDPNIGITCRDVLDEIHNYLYVLVWQEEVDGVPASELESFVAAYEANRSRADHRGEPALSLTKRSKAMRRVDWLVRNTFFGGLDRDDKYIAERFSAAMPAGSAFVLRSQDAAITLD
ncbi:hypothetical protein PLICRDRAFT_685749 [Plicaturopsis crispa FD-325 SS-3]|nr:hypothetical protein PLICRDRAFT_685749 [Plicaturopsis crispa FD-325 SS-3]